MGCGKSTIGRLLAKKLGVSFFDTDALIAQKLGLSIADIFSTEGEAFFRREERDLISQLAIKRPRGVVSLGGGAVLDAHNRSIFLKHHWINLTAPLSVIQARTGKNNKRPLLGKTLEETEQLLRVRQPFYRLAPTQLDTSKWANDEKVKKIIQGIRFK